jgi:hypothetical protein
MTKAADFLRLILLTRALLKAPNQEHEREHFDFVALLRPLHAGLCGVRHRCSSTRAFRVTAEFYAKNENDGEDQIADH